MTIHAAASGDFKLWLVFCACFSTLVALLPLQTADSALLTSAEAFGSSGATVTQVVVALSAPVDARDTTADLLATLEEHSASVVMTRDPDAGFVFVSDRKGLFVEATVALGPGEVLVSERLSSDLGFVEALAGRGYVAAGSIPALALVEGTHPNVVAAAGEDSFGSGYYLFTAPVNGDIDALHKDLDRLWATHGMDVVHAAVASPPDRWARLLDVGNPYSLFLWLTLLGAVIGLVVVGRSPSSQAAGWLRIAASYGATRTVAWRRVWAQYALSAAVGTALGCGLIWLLAHTIGQPNLYAGPVPLLLKMLVFSLAGLAVAMLVGAAHAWAAVRGVDREICW